MPRMMIPDTVKHRSKVRVPKPTLRIPARLVNFNGKQYAIDPVGLLMEEVGLTTLINSTLLDRQAIHAPSSQIGHIDFPGLVFTERTDLDLGLQHLGCVPCSRLISR
jgi:hypothetical protein